MYFRIMTRINTGVRPSELPSKLLIAEHREIKRIPNTITSGKARIDNIPSQFTLNAGHVKFFYNKLSYLKKRYIALYNECVLRGFNVQNYIAAWDNIPNSLMNDYSEQKRDRELIIERIKNKGFKLIV